MGIGLSITSSGVNRYLPSLVTSSLMEFYDDVVYWEIAKGRSKFFVTFERGQYSLANNMQESIGTMEINFPQLTNNSSSTFDASASLGGSRINTSYKSFLQDDEILEGTVTSSAYHGFIPITEIKGTRFFETTITSSISKSFILNYEIHSGSTSVSSSRTINASYFYPFSSYQLSVLRKSPTLIIDLDEDSELPNGLGSKGFVAIPSQTHIKIKDNLEYYLEKAGLINKTTKTKSPKKGI
jgi:hypothetical protein